jgi:hypothetical protein
MCNVHYLACNATQCNADVEGAEMSALQSHDFSRVSVDVLLVEVESASCSAGGCLFPDDPAAERRAGIRKYLEKRGFDCSRMLKGSLVCVHKSFVPSVKPSH